MIAGIQRHFVRIRDAQPRCAFGQRHPFVLRLHDRRVLRRGLAARDDAFDADALAREQSENASARVDHTKPCLQAHVCRNVRKAGRDAPHIHNAEPSAELDRLEPHRRPDRRIGELTFPHHPVAANDRPHRLAGERHTGEG